MLKIDFLVALDLNAVLGRVFQLLRSRPLPFSDRRDDLQVGGQCLKRDVEPNLVIAFARTAMRDRRGTMLARHAYHELRDQRASQRGC